MATVPNSGNLNKRWYELYFKDSWTVFLDMLFAFSSDVDPFHVCFPYCRINIQAI